MTMPTPDPRQASDRYEEPAVGPAGPSGVSPAPEPAPVTVTFSLDTSQLTDGFDRAKESAIRFDNDRRLLMVIGGLLRSHRKAAGMSQQDLATRTGFSRSSIANIEAGRQDTLITRLVALAEALGVPPTNLLAAGTADASTIEPLHQLASEVDRLADENHHLRRVMANARDALGAPDGE